MKFKNRYLLKSALAVLLAASPVPATATDGLIMLVGDVLPLNNQVVWRNLVRLSERRAGEHLVIAAAHKRPKLYGGFALRSYQQYGKEADLVPLAEEFQEFSTDFRFLAEDAPTIERLQNASSVFFVGGAPQRLSKVLIDRKGRPTPLAGAVEEAYENGALIVGGIPGRVVVSTDADPLHVLDEGELDDDDFAAGLKLLENDWYVDQHFFSRGRFAAAFVAMHQFGMRYGIGVGLDTAALVHGESVEVLGNRGIVIVDLSESTFKDSWFEPTITNVRLSYLENGDRIQMDSGTIVPHSSKKNGFELTPNAAVSDGEKFIASTEVFKSGELVRLMHGALDSKSGQTWGYALHEDDDDEGFEFRFHTGPDSRGWVSVDGEQERVTLENIYLDINPI